MTLSAERLADLRRLVEAATPGPWTVYEGKYAAHVNPGFDVSIDCNTGANAALVVAARTALPELLDEVERLRSILDALHMTACSRGFSYKGCLACEGEKVASPAPSPPEPA